MTSTYGPMEEVLVTSDQHFFHHNILRHCPDRPWGSVEEMNFAFIENWNAVVPTSGTVFTLGDWAMRLNEDTLAIRSLLNGTVILVPGNHDPMFSGHRKGREEARRRFEDAGFIVADELIHMTLTGSGGEHVPVRMCHFPTRPDAVEVDHTGRDRYREWRPEPDGRWLLHGHVHQNGGVNRERKTINVGVDAPYTRFAPMSQEQVVDIILDRGAGR